MLVRESVGLEGAPHRRSATGLLGTRLSGRGGLAAILKRSLNRGNQGTDRPPFDLVHQPFDGSWEPAISGRPYIPSKDQASSPAIVLCYTLSVAVPRGLGVPNGRRHAEAADPLAVRLTRYPASTAQSVRSSSQSIKSSAKVRVSFSLVARGRWRKARRSRRLPPSSLVRATRRAILGNGVATGRGILGNGVAARREILGNRVAVPPLVVPVVRMLGRLVIPTVGHARRSPGIARWMVLTTVISGMTAVGARSVARLALVPRGAIGA
jgi:hypothetical protein